MKMGKWKEFESAVKNLRMSKGELLDIAYDKEWNGIDCAIPQYMIGKEICASDIFCKATDCTGTSYRVIDLRDIVPDTIANFIIEYVNLKSSVYKAILENKENVPAYTMEKYESMHDKYWNMFRH